MFYRISGKFANGHSFSIATVEASDARGAMDTVLAAEEIRSYGHPVTSITVKALTGKTRKIRISSKPAKERDRKPKVAPTAAEAAAKPTRRTK